MQDEGCMEMFIILEGSLHGRTELEDMPTVTTQAANEDTDNTALSQQTPTAAAGIDKTEGGCHSYPRWTAAGSCRHLHACRHRGAASVPAATNLFEVEQRCTWSSSGSRECQRAAAGGAGQGCRVGAGTAAGELDAGQLRQQHL